MTNSTAQKGHGHGVGTAGSHGVWPPPLEELPPALRERLSRVRLLCLDVDGVLSDGHLYFLGEDEQAPRWGLRFAVRDGVGVKRLQAAGVEVAILSEGALPGGQVRGRSLGIRHAYFGLKDKLGRFTTPDPLGHLGGANLYAYASNDPTLLNDPFGLKAWYERVRAQRQKTGQPMIAHINHPNFRWGITPEELMEVKGELFFEVYNGHPQVENDGIYHVVYSESVLTKCPLKEVGHGLRPGFLVVLAVFNFKVLYVVKGAVPFACKFGDQVHRVVN